MRTKIESKDNLKEFILNNTRKNKTKSSTDFLIYSMRTDSVNHCRKIRLIQPKTILFIKKKNSTLAVRFSCNIWTKIDLSSFSTFPEYENKSTQFL